AFVAFFEMITSLFKIIVLSPFYCTSKKTPNLNRLAKAAHDNLHKNTYFFAGFVVGISTKKSRTEDYCRGHFEDLNSKLFRPIGPKVEEIVDETPTAPTATEVEAPLALTMMQAKLLGAPTGEIKVAAEPAKEEAPAISMAALQAYSLDLARKQEAP